MWFTDYIIVNKSCTNYIIRNKTVLAESASFLNTNKIIHRNRCEQHLWLSRYTRRMNRNTFMFFFYVSVIYITSMRNKNFIELRICNYCCY